ncbi:unnamed protein product [Bursaphelenchus okinawaensis]|uniref:G_PROTEIN_RECEP_F1_2 domain-containing protein n=1 Tax=Bursaphelenchus okinawaensis TaxID=465554 RepID=A0A811K2S0_9BILA|nr:unnamed protein product [Bursaphelenchus okinawaensis]CAG9089902.1 unnamed protein product [Bursaphelenchus okinawaensis]
MTIPMRAIHRTVDVIGGVMGVVLCFAVVVLTMTVVKNKTLKMYKIMIICTAVVDFFYALNSLITMSTASLAGDLVYFILDNPYLPQSSLVAYSAVATQLFMMFLCFCILPLQFIYRYGVLLSKPFTIT